MEYICVLWRETWSHTASDGDSTYLVVGLEVVNLFVEGKQPELLTHEDNSIQLILEPRGVSRGSLY